MIQKKTSMWRFYSNKLAKKKDNKHNIVHDKSYISLFVAFFCHRECMKMHYDILSSLGSILNGDSPKWPSQDHFLN